MWARQRPHRKGLRKHFLCSSRTNTALIFLGTGMLHPPAHAHPTASLKVPCPLRSRPISAWWQEGQPALPVPLAHAQPPLPQSPAGRQARGWAGEQLPLGVRDGETPLGP